MSPKSYKTEIHPSGDQILKIQKTIGTCRFLKNLYIDHNTKAYKEGKKFVAGNSFYDYVKGEYLEENPDNTWIKEVSSKSRKQAILDTEKAFKRFFRKESKYPKFKKKKNNDVSMYFVRSDAKHIIQVDRHRIKIPTLGWVRIKEKGYIPTNDSGKFIVSGRVSKKADRYYVSVFVDDTQPVNDEQKITSQPIGVDLGVKEFAVVSDGGVYENVNKSNKVKNLHKKLKRQQRSLSRKYENKKKKGGDTGKNIVKHILKIQKTHKKITDTRENYINHVVHDLVKANPDYIAIEDLHISGMMKNKHLSRAVAEQNLFTFRTKLQNKCKEMNIELRVVNRFYPSSKLCNVCGYKKTNLKLSDRMYYCDKCGYESDRDLNASINIRDSVDYVVFC